MRESFVRELFYGNISPWEQRRAYTPEQAALIAKVDDIAEHFKNVLSPEEYKKFAQMQELESRLDVDNAADLFEHAFCLVVRMLIDVFVYKGM